MVGVVVVVGEVGGGSDSGGGVGTKRRVLVGVLVTRRRPAKKLQISTSQDSEPGETYLYGV